MDKPTIAGRKPIKATLKPSGQFWCSCGESTNQPWCDGSHKGTGFTPLKIAVDEETEAHMCLCKHTKNPGYCDGSHSKLPKDEVAE